MINVEENEKQKEDSVNTSALIMSETNVGKQNRSGRINGRELNPALRIGDEGFLSSPKRLSAKDTNFVVLGFSPFDLKLLEQTLTWKRGAGGSDRTSSYRRSFQSIQSCTPQLCWNHT